MQPVIEELIKRDSVDSNFPSLPNIISFAAVFCTSEIFVKLVVIYFKSNSADGSRLSFFDLFVISSPAVMHLATFALYYWAKKRGLQGVIVACLFIHYIYNIARSQALSSRLVEYFYIDTAIMMLLTIFLLASSFHFRGLLENDD
jgi:hypothetical protein